MSVTEKRLEASRLLTRQTAWKRRNPEKRQAHHAVKAAIRSGRLVRQPCAECGAPQGEAHHASYDREHWLDVEWLCPRHHKARHRRQIVKTRGEASDAASPDLKR